MAKPRMEKTHHSLITDGVEEHEQTLGVLKPFWVFFGSNMGIATWLMGLLVAGMNLSFTDSIFSITLGSAVGGVLLGALSVMGPRLQLSQMEMSKFPLGNGGKKVAAALSWCSAIGWDAINNIFSAAAIVTFFSHYGFALPFWLSLVGIVLIQLVIGVYGHHLIQGTAKYTGIILSAFFILVGIIAVHTSPLVATASTSAFKDIFGAFSLLVFFNVAGWGTYMSDYTRYLPKTMPRRKVFLSLFSSVFLSTLILSLIGYLSAPLVSDPSPAGISTSLQNIAGSFGPLVLFLIGFSAIPANAINDNSAAYNMISAGFKFSRPFAAIFGALFGFVLCLLASDSFVDFFENFLSLFTHWIAPWSAILLVYFFVVGKKERKAPANLTTGGLIFLSVSILSVMLFSANSLYTGLLSPMVGGLDIGPYIGFVVAGSLYYCSLRLGKRHAR